MMMRLSLMAALPLCAAGAALAQPPVLPAETVDGCGKADAARRWAAAAARELDENDPAVAALEREALDDTDLLHCDLEIEIFPAAEELAGRNTLTVMSLVDGLSEFTFRLRTQYAITSATIGAGTPVSVATLSTTTRRATLDRAYNTGETFDLTIEYEGDPVNVGLGSINYASVGGNDIVFTLSEPYFSYSWWPCKDGDVFEPGNNADKFTLDFAIIAPQDMRSVSIGVLEGIDALTGGRDRYRWSSDYPIATYLVAFSSTVYNTWTVPYNHAGGTMPVEFNIFPGDDTPDNRADWETCVTMLDTFAPLYGPYPFLDEKYGIYEFLFGGGMEHQTNSGQGTFNVSITAHELAHQWWGDAVTCRTWHDIWLNEGFARYAQALWEEFQPGGSQAALHGTMAAFRPEDVDGSVYVYDAGNVNRIFSTNFSYNKASWVLHQLRHVVGDETFWDIHAAYRAAYEGSAATTDDFIAVASGVAGQDLSWFFDPWVYGVGAPSYEHGWQTFAVNGQNYLRLYLEQTQPASYGIFTMPVDIRVTRPGGSETHVVWNDEWGEHFVIPISAAASAVSVDPQNWILAEDKTQIAYVNGPPKIVQTAPLPGASLPQGGGPAELTVTFSQNVAVAPGDFSVVGAQSGAAPFTLSYAAGSFTATLDFAAGLPSDAYTVTVNDTVDAAVGALALDGELASNAPEALPSGEGLAGGDAVFAFTVAAACSADVDGDGQVNITDLGILLANFGQSGTHADGDVSGDGQVNITDLGAVLSEFGATCS